MKLLIADVPKAQLQDDFWYLAISPTDNTTTFTSGILYNTKFKGNKVTRRSY